jgi:Na+/melibiose symporter-like transporter
VSKKLGKKWAFIIASAVGVVSFIGMYFVPQFPEADYADMMLSLGHMPGWAWVFVVTLGIGIGGIQLMPFTMIPDAINISLHADDKSEGAYYGVVTLAQKVGTGVATLLIGPVLQGLRYKAPPIGYDTAANGLFEQSFETSAGIRDLFIFLSVAIVVVGALAVIRYKVDRQALHEKMLIDKTTNIDGSLKEAAAEGTTVPEETPFTEESTSL